ncbi:H-NS family nucleoid-associated regulatory protein [Burkholderia sp. Ac-20365]|uniref:H-NS family nucleoid-associated regulatory protein n=1 Tax=Burkholderia sp. Ac-20365 TaxID=2703897 RepID=UPI00197B6F5E|nr:H-NS family nucleoid-associated regulatory protein [Burkholderia sp. Ac-20365]MBN3761320.1 H-NS histone family protein [Burkholderia sp. Ac-20365]
MKQHFDDEARERLIRWIRRRMDEFDISLEALATALNEPIYRDAHGNEWNGRGDMPDWLRAATNAGANLDFFRTEPIQSIKEEDELLASSFFRRSAGAEA